MSTRVKEISEFLCGPSETYRTSASGSSGGVRKLGGKSVNRVSVFVVRVNGEGWEVDAFFIGALCGESRKTG